MDIKSDLLNAGEALLRCREGVESALSGLPPRSATYRVGVDALSAVPDLEGIRIHAATSNAVLLEALERVRVPGTLIGDVLLAKSSDIPEDEQENAIRRLTTRWFRRPLHSARFAMAKHELMRRADQNETSPQVELQKATTQAFLLALADVDDAGDLFHLDFLSDLRASVANHVSEDLLGPGWRRRYSGKEQPLSADEEYEDDLNEQFQAEIRMLLQSLGDHWTDFPPKQRAALRALLEDRTLPNDQRQALFRLRNSRRFLELLTDDGRFSKN